MASLIKTVRINKPQLITINDLGHIIVFYGDYALSIFGKEDKCRLLQKNSIGEIIGEKTFQTISDAMDWIEANCPQVKAV